MCLTDAGDTERLKPVSTFEASGKERYKKRIIQYWVGNEKDNKIIDIKQEETNQLCKTTLSS